MSAVRVLGAMYLATASVFGVAIALHEHPAWKLVADGAGDAVARTASEQILQPASEVARDQLVAFFDAIDPPSAAVALAPRSRLAVSRRSRELAEVDSQSRSAPFESLAPPLPLRRAVTGGETEGAPEPLMAPGATEQPDATASGEPGWSQKLGPGSRSLSPAELSRVVARLKQNLTPELLKNFELFLYVSKATAGPWAQHMYVFDKTRVGGLDLQYNWPVSTGRERIELGPDGGRRTTHTPAGYYQIDPDRLYSHYTSAEWQKPMPYSMFFNWIKRGRKTGLAIHAAVGDEIEQLGSRASAGCIRLSPEDASTLFSLVKAHYRGLAPKFAYNRRTGTMSNEGILLHDASGHVQLAEGYKVLVFIENYGGNDNVVAALF
jgi:hypothetical protein